MLWLHLSCVCASCMPNHFVETLCCAMRLCDIAVCICIMLGEVLACIVNEIRSRQMVKDGGEPVATLTAQLIMHTMVSMTMTSQIPGQLKDCIKVVLQLCTRVASCVSMHGIYMYASCLTECTHLSYRRNSPKIMWIHPRIFGSR